jgi:hypothetical protein
MEHWGYTDEVKRSARRRRRLDDKREAEERTPELDDDELTQLATP